jgi:hypothetical protein
MTTNNLDRRLARLECAKDVEEEPHPGIIFMTPEEFHKAFPDGVARGRGLFWISRKGPP